MIRNWIAAGAFAVAASMSTGALAQTSTIPGEQVGLAVGAPLPEGVYAINTFFYRTPDAPSSVSPVDIAVNIPILVWATPFVPLGGRIELLVAPPTVFALGRQSGPNGVRDLSINVGTFVGGIWAFNLGGNVGISFLGGIYLNRLNADRGVLVSNSGQFIGAPVLPQLSSNTYRAGVAISYTGDNWNLTANLTGNFYDSPSSFGGSAVFGTRGPFFLSNALNLDLTATKKFDLFNEGKPKFEFGAIGYGTVNIDRNADIVGRQGRFALGALIGYDFGIFNAQLYAARDVITQANYIDAIGRRGDIPNTEAAFRIIVPLYSPAQTSTAIVRKY